MADLAENYQKLLHGVASGGGDTNRRTALEAEIRIRLTQDQIASADKIAQASRDTANSLTRATWMLSAATVVLAVATVVLVIVTATQ